MNRNYDIYSVTSNYTGMLWSEVFYDSASFIDKVTAVGSDTTNLAELYRILANKYSFSTTRYTMEEAFVLAIKRELEMTWPIYLRQKAIATTLFDLTVADIMKQMETIRTGSRDSTMSGADSNTTNTTNDSSGTNTVNRDNLQNTVNANNSPVTNAATVAIANKSNIQVSNKGTDGTTFVNEDTGVITGSGTNSGLASETANDTMSVLSNKLDAITRQYESTAVDYLKQIYRKTDSLFKVIL